MSNNIKSSKEILDIFFSEIECIKNIDLKIAKMLSKLYNEDSLTDKSIKNELEIMRDSDVNKNQ